MTTPAPLPPEEPKAKTGLSTYVVAAVLAAVVLLAAAYWFQPGGTATDSRAIDWGTATATAIERNEAAALSVLSGSVFCLENYAKSNPKSGYPAAIEQLGPTGSGCLDAGWTDKIARGEPVSGYLVTYTPVPLEGRNAGFELQARPHRFAVDGVNSFFLDEPDFYMVRVTAKNRQANERDPLFH